MLKGGILVTTLAGSEMRATMDIDTTVRSMSLTFQKIKGVIEEIMNTDVGDGVSFQITGSKDIMKDMEYPGISFTLEATLDRLRQPIKIDVSTGDVMISGPEEFSYPLMFEDREITLWAYSVETVLAEKLEAVLSRGISNTRMRDYYDIFILEQQKTDNIDFTLLKESLYAVCEKRGSVKCLENATQIMDDIAESTMIRNEWHRYQKANFYVGDISWKDVLNCVRKYLAILTGA